MKKTILLLAVLLIAVFQLTAQQLPFQGKLYQDGVPVNGMRNFEFEIESLDWTEAHNSIQVTKGLYALTLGNVNTLPANLFTKNQRSRILKIMVDGVLLDEMTLYAPLEVDGDPENELQALKMSGDTLHLTKGNFVLLNRDGENISSTLSVGKLDTISDKIAQTSGTDNKMTTNTWQSFTPSRTGLITSIEIQFNNTNNTNLVLKVGKGEGNISFDNQFPVLAADFPSQNWLQGQVIQLDEPIEVEAFEKYTFLLESNGIEFEVGATTTDEYRDGISNFGITVDLNFVVNYNVISGYTFNVTEKGNVGIGVDEPQEKLEVAGRIKDATGYIAPVGMIVAFGGHKSKVPEGWKLCQGQWLQKSEFPELWNAIQHSWGKEPTNDGIFKLPNFRGMFLRGVADSEGTNVDPDVNSRYNPYGGNIGNRVGSYQWDMFAKHRHGYEDVFMSVNAPFWSTYINKKAIPSNFGSGKAPDWNNTGYYTGEATTYQGGNETRPVNAYVHYIIKY